VGGLTQGGTVCKPLSTLFLNACSKCLQVSPGLGGAYNGVGLRPWAMPAFGNVALVRPWSAAGVARQQISGLPHALLQHAVGRAMVGPAMLAPLAAPRQLNEAEAAAMCANAMTEVAEVQVHSHESSTVKARQRHCEQLQEFLSHSNGSAIYLPAGASTW
jgi:hypothetical protein